MKGIIPIVLNESALYICSFSSGQVKNELILNQMPQANYFFFSDFSMILINWPFTLSLNCNCYLMVGLES